MRIPEIEANVALDIHIGAPGEVTQKDRVVVDTRVLGLNVGFSPRGEVKTPVPKTLMWVLDSDEEAPAKAHVLTVDDIRIAVQCVCTAGEAETPEDVPA